MAVRPEHRGVRLAEGGLEALAEAGLALGLAGSLSEAMQTVAATTPQASVRLLGPAEAPVFRLKGYYRFHFQLQSPGAAALHDLLRAVLVSARPPRGVEFTVDVDPLNML